MSQEKTELIVKICENLPLNMTVLEKNGCCQKPEHNCKYNRSNLSSDLHFCHKKTTTPDLPILRIAI